MNKISRAASAQMPAQPAGNAVFGIGWKVRALAVALVAASTLSTLSTKAEAQMRNYHADFTCQAASHVTCYFTIFLGSRGVSGFTLRAGQRHTFTGVRPGDTYCASTQGQPRADTCTRSPVRMY